MSSWKKICYPIDFSAPSRLAMEEAADLAWRSGGEIRLVHVVEPIQGPIATETLVPP